MVRSDGDHNDDDNNDGGRDGVGRGGHEGWGSRDSGGPAISRLAVKFCIGQPHVSASEWHVSREFVHPEYTTYTFCVVSSWSWTKTYLLTKYAIPPLWFVSQMSVVS